MTTVYEIEVDPGAYTSLWLTQKSIGKQHAEHCKKLSKFDEIDNIFRKPHVSVLGHSQDDNFSFLTGDPDQWRMVSSGKAISEDTTRPKAVVVVLSPTRHEDDCHLSEKDIQLLEIVNDRTEQPENIVYLVNAKDDNVHDTHELAKLSDEIQFKTSRKRKKNDFFKKLFFLEDDQVPVRIGLCLLNSLTCIIKRIHQKVQHFNDFTNNKLADLVKNKDSNIQYIEKFISKSGFKICNLASQRSNRLKIRNLSKLLRKEIERKDLLIAVEIATGNKTNHLGKKFETRLNICLKKRKSFLKKDKIRLHNGRTSKFSSARLTRSMTKEPSKRELEGLSATRTLKAKTCITHYCQTNCLNVFCKNDYEEMAKDVYTELLDSSTKYVNSHTKDLAAFAKTISDERSKRSYSLNLHEWKIVAMRSELVKGFGCVKNNICIYLKNDDKDEERRVSVYAQKYLNDPPGKYQLRIEYKQRNITLFSKLEQGSKINRKGPEEPRKYGSLGMFLEDKKGKYFFTTCAHVITKDECAYSADDNSELGRNVFIYQSESNTNDKNDPYIDFSVVQVSPEKDLTCTFGLKATGGNFISGRIFKGDLSEILDQNVYKWGATPPCLRKGKCIGYEDEGSLLYLMVDTNDFAKEGDSGAIICVGEDVDAGLAAFVIIGGSQNDSECTSASNSEPSYLVYKVSHALEKVSNMKPCLIPCTKTISISSSVSGSVQRKSKRKRPDAV